MIITATDTSRKIHIYDSKTYHFIGSFSAHSSPVTQIYSFEEKIWTLSLSEIRVWITPKLNQLQCIHTFHTLASRPRTIISNSFKNILTGATDGSVLLWDHHSCSVQQEMIVYCNHDSTHGIISLCEDKFKYLWVITANRIAVWPNANNLHDDMSHHHPSQSSSTPSLASIQKSQSLDTRSVRSSLLQQRGKFPQRATPRGGRGGGSGIGPRPTPPPRISTADNVRSNTVTDLTRRSRTTFIQSPVQDKKRAFTHHDQTNHDSPNLIQSADTPIQNNISNDYHDNNKPISAPTTPLRALVSPRTPKPAPPPRKLSSESLIDKNNQLDFNSSSIVVVDKEKKLQRRKKKKIDVFYGEQSTQVTSKVNLSKLIGVIPGLELSMIDTDHPVQILCSRVDGKLKIELTCPNGPPPIKESSTTTPDSSSTPKEPE